MVQLPAHGNARLGSRLEQHRLQRELTHVHVVHSRACDDTGMSYVVKCGAVCGETVLVLGCDPCKSVAVRVPACARNSHVESCREF